MNEDSGALAKPPPVSAVASLRSAASADSKLARDVPAPEAAAAAVPLSQKEKGKVQYSALLTASLRAQESARSDALFNDPFAAMLSDGMSTRHAHFVYRRYKLEEREQYADQAKQEVAEILKDKEERPFISVRTRYVDDYLSERVSALRRLSQDEQEPLRLQIVMLGAGLDSRPYRLQCLAPQSMHGASTGSVAPAPESSACECKRQQLQEQITVYELDHAGTIDYKQRKLSQVPALCRVVRGSADFTAAPGDLSSLAYWPPVHAGAVTAATAPPGDDSVSHPISTGRIKPSSSILPSKADCACVMCGRESQTASAEVCDDPSTDAVSGVQLGPKDPAWLHALAHMGFRCDVTTIWIAEGVLMYLNRHHVCWMLQSMAKASSRAPLSALCADIVNKDCTLSKLSWCILFRWGLEEEHHSAFAAAHGWRMLDRAEIGKHGVSYGRYLREPVVDTTSRPQYPPMTLRSYIWQCQLDTDWVRKKALVPKSLPATSVDHARSTRSDTTAAAADDAGAGTALSALPVNGDNGTSTDTAEAGRKSPRKRPFPYCDHMSMMVHRVRDRKQSNRPGNSVASHGVASSTRASPPVTTQPAPAAACAGVLHDDDDLTALFDPS